MQATASCFDAHGAPHLSHTLGGSVQISASRLTTGIRIHAQDRLAQCSSPSGIASGALANCAPLPACRLPVWPRAGGPSRRVESVCSV
jgi:hypothetical protein